MTSTSSIDIDNFYIGPFGFKLVGNDKIPSEIVQNITSLPGSSWRAEIVGASILIYAAFEFCTYNIGLEGSLDMLKFEKDDGDRNSDYVVLKDNHGNIVFDTRK
jgi:hypothetical protein